MDFRYVGGATVDSDCSQLPKCKGDFPVASKSSNHGSDF